MSIKSRLELFYRLPFDTAINRHHWELKKSLNQISKETGIIRQSIMHICKANKIPLRNSRQHLEDIGAPKGEKHWAWGLTKETSSKYRAASRRMILENPSQDSDAQTRRAKSISRTYRRKPWKQEVLAEKILIELSVSYKAQYPVDRYIIDFFIPHLNLALEIDSTRHWGKIRRDAAAIRDAKLLSLGIKTLRICKSELEKDGFSDRLRAMLSTYENRN